MERLAQQIERDKSAVAEAAQRDKERIRSATSLGELDGDTLSRYLLGPELQARAATLLQWIRWARWCLLDGLDDSRLFRGRGQDVDLAGPQGPSLLIRSLVVEGDGCWGRDVVPFRCQATGLTSRPELHGEAIRLKLQTDGPVAMAVEAQFDRRGKTPHESFLIDIPALAVKQWTLGRPDRLAITASPGTLRLRATLNVKGGELQGKLQLHQNPVDLKPRLGPSSRVGDLARLLETTTQHVRSLDAQVELTGPLEAPSFELRSSLGPQLSAGFQKAFQQTLTVRRDELMSRVRMAVDGELADLDQTLQAKKAEALGTLQLGDLEINKLTLRVAGGLKPSELLRDNIPPAIPLWRSNINRR
jgi:uncharacterized protein (TIGR03545 family)